MFGKLKHDDTSRIMAELEWEIRHSGRVHATLDKAAVSFMLRSQLVMQCSIQIRRCRSTSHQR